MVARRCSTKFYEAANVRTRHRDVQKRSSLYGTNIKALRTLGVAPKPTLPRLAIQPPPRVEIRSPSPATVEKKGIGRNFLNAIKSIRSNSRQRRVESRRAYVSMMWKKYKDCPVQVRKRVEPVRPGGAVVSIASANPERDASSEVEDEENAPAESRSQSQYQSDDGDENDDEDEDEGPPKEGGDYIKSLIAKF